MLRLMPNETYRLGWPDTAADSDVLLLTFGRLVYWQVTGRMVLRPICRLNI